MQKELNIIRYDDLPMGGFAGVVEKQMVMNKEIWPQSEGRGISNGLGDFIYLAMGYFKPNDGAPVHPHEDVDIVSFIYSGEIGHKGSLGDGTKITAPGVQVQRAGSGMTHAEFSVTDKKAEIAQMWFKPPKNGLRPEYKEFKIEGTGLMTVHGGDESTFDSNMVCKIGFIDSETEIFIEGEGIAIVFDGEVSIEGNTLKERDLAEGVDMNLRSMTKTGLIVITKN